MKKVLLLTAFIWAFALNAQDFQNTWIDYDQTYYKFELEDDGLYRIPFEVIQQAGLPSGTSGFKLMNKGEEVPIYVSASGNMSAGDYIEFVGFRNDGKFDTQLFMSPLDQLTDRNSLFTDKNAYYLFWDNTSAGLRYEDVSNNVNNPPAKEQYFTHNFRRILDNAHFEGAPDTRELAGVNTYLSNFGVSEGFVGSKVGPGLEQDYILQTDNAYIDPAMSAKFEVRVVGRSNDVYIASGDHHFQIRVNGELYADDIYDGYDYKLVDFNVPITEMGNSNTLTLKSVGDIWNPDWTNAAIDANSLAYIFVEYPHTFDFNNRRDLLFTLANDEDKYIEIENFNGGNAPVIYDLDARKRIIPVLENDIYKVLIDQDLSAPDKRQFIIANTSSSLSLEEIEGLTEKQFTDLSDPANAADFVILTNKLLMQPDDEDGINQAQRYADYRKGVDGGSHQVLLLDVDEVYDQFSLGIRQHPVAIQQLVNYMKQQYNLNVWDVNPEFLFLLGKSLRYNYCTNSAADFESNMVPTYGSSGSDNMLAAANKFTYINQMAVGRVSARTPEDVREYLNKAKEYEALLNDDGMCDVESRKWFKELIHIGSGNNEDEAEQFAGYLSKYEEIVEDTLFGGEVVLNLSSQTQSIIPAPVESFINNGIGVITFVGHSNGEFWSYDLRSPDFYDNKGKYPFIVSSSCFVGDIHQPFDEESRIMAEIWSTFPERGCIGFLASVKFGFPIYLDLFTEALYRNFTYKHYGEGMGKVIQNTILDIHDPDEIGIQVTSQEFTLSGDPAIPIYFFERPEYAISDEDVTITPSIITAAIDSFEVQVIVANYGKAVNENITIAVERGYPDGSTDLIASIDVFSPTLADTFTLVVPNSGDDILGTNSINVFVDYGNALEEDCESNNDVVRNFQVLPTTAIPIDPCNYAIVDRQGITLKASTANPIVEEQPYIIQIDTSILFNNPLDSDTINSVGGVIEFTPILTMQENTVYYWRVALLQNISEGLEWQGHSFTFIEAHPDGWNQQHYYQYEENSFEDFSINSDNRLFEYSGNTNFLRVVNGHTDGGIGPNSIAMFLNGSAQAINSCLINNTEECNGGIQIAVFEPDSILVAWQSVQQELPPDLTSECDKKGQYGNIHCSTSITSNVFQFPTGTEEGLQNLIGFINDIPDEHYVLAYSINDHHMEMDQALISLQEPVYDFFGGMGATNIEGLNNQTPFVVFGRKGNIQFGNRVEEIGEDVNTIIDIDITVSEAFGEMFSQNVGPASAWKTIEWDFTSLDVQDADQISVDIYGYGPNGTRDFLMTTATTQDTDISMIDANTYNRLQLVLKTADYTFITAPQLDFWRVTFDRYTELALNENLGFEFCCDTLASGEFGSFSMAISNASNILTDSIEIAYTVIDANNVSHPVDYDAQAPLQPGETFTSEVNFQGASSGQNYLLVELNPDGAQNEKYSFNNVLQLPFWVGADNINPIVDVTFDGDHILSGDIVSPTPLIEIKIKDENTNLAMNDTSIANVWIIEPNGTQRELSFQNDDVTFIPPSDVAAQNEASISFTPDLAEDGRYQLVIRGRDISGNLAATQDYVLAFEVISEAMISNVINYPNPFTTSTQFVFTLTGTEVPDNLKIQVMSVSGKVVREVTLAELGDVKIGKNISDFRWDGSDQYGNELANGVYFYRVVASDAGEDLKLFTNPEGRYNMSSTAKMDDLFSSKGIGKMYKMR